MKTTGILGGMSWESTALYYRALNEAVRQRLGGLHSARIILNSIDFAAIEALQQAGDWHAAGMLLADEAKRVEAAGADFLIIATNTMHKVADVIELAIDIPLLHIADATAAALVRDGRKRVGVLGTAFTMEQSFYRERLQRHGIEVLVPLHEDREVVHRVIYEELCLGKVTDAARTSYLRIIEELAGDGAQGIVLGCTEISLLVSPRDTEVPLYDTTMLHAQAAVDVALN